MQLLHVASIQFNSFIQYRTIQSNPIQLFAGNFAISSAHPLPLLECLLDGPADVQVSVLAAGHASLLPGVELVPAGAGALFEALLDEGVHHRLHDLLVGLVLGLDHDGLLLLGGEAVGVHGCNLI